MPGIREEVRGTDGRSLRRGPMAMPNQQDAELSEIRERLASAGFAAQLDVQRGIDHGVWGGCSERERRRIIKRRALAARGVPVAVA